MLSQSSNEERKNFGLGESCNKCGKINHFESKCQETSNKSARFDRHSSQGRRQYKRYADTGRVNQMGVVRLYIHT